VEGALDRGIRHPSRGGGERGLGGGLVSASPASKRKQTGVGSRSLRRERQRWNRIVAAGRQRPRHAPEIPIIRGGVHAPISIHQSAYGVVKRSYPRGSQPWGAQTSQGENQHPPRNARDAGTRYGSSSKQTSVGFISTGAVALKSGNAGLSPKEAWAHPGRCGRVEKRRIGERVDPSS